MENSEHGHRRTLLRVRYEWRKSEAESENDCEPDPPLGPPPAGMAGGSLAAKSGPVPASSALITYAFASRRATSGDGGVDRSMRRLIPLPLLITALPSGLRQRARKWTRAAACAGQAAQWRWAAAMTILLASSGFSRSVLMTRS